MLRGTLFCLCLVSALDYADKFALAGLFLPLQRHFSVGAEALAQLFVAQNLSLAVFSPLWGHLADSTSFSRPVLLAAASLAWGMLTMASAAPGLGFPALIAMRALTGAALAALIPVSQLMVADMAQEQQRGRLFGLIGSAGWAGAVCGTIFSTSACSP